MKTTVNNGCAKDKKRITPEQVRTLKKSVEKMAKSDEQFIFMIFKNPNGTDNITEYSYNMMPEKVEHYWKEALRRAELQGGR